MELFPVKAVIYPTEINKAIAYVYCFMNWHKIYIMPVSTGVPPEVLTLIFCDFLWVSFRKCRSNHVLNQRTTHKAHSSRVTSAQSRREESRFAAANLSLAFPHKGCLCGRANNGTRRTAALLSEGKQRDRVPPGFQSLWKVAVERLSQRLRNSADELGRKDLVVTG